MNKKRIDPAMIIVYFIFGISLLYFIAQLGYSFDTTPKTHSGQLDILTVVEKAGNNISQPTLIKENITNTESYTFKFTMLGCMCGILWILYKVTTQKKYRKGKEHGSARWATVQEAKKLLDKKNKSNNIVFTNDVGMSLNTRKTRKNLNVLIIGGSGAGKTRFYAKPNIMQMNTSYVITDPKGELLRSSGKMLEQDGYTVKVFNLINMQNSYNYNSFAYLQDSNGKYNDANVMKLVNTLLKNTKTEGQSQGEQFWEDATKALLLAIVYFLVYEGNENEKNWATVMEILKLAEVKEDEEDYKSPFDFMFEDLEKQNPKHMAVKYYKDYKKAAGKTAKSILISCSVRLAAFNIEDVINLTYKDNINIRELGEKKTALFVVIPDSDDTFNFLVAMLYTQIFDVLYSLADYKYKGRLPLHVRFMLDEFANIGTIPRFDKLVATMRSREISVNVIIQNMAQLKTMYKDSWESIVGNCDSMLFLGGKEQTSLDYISKALGKETIDTVNRNVSRSYRQNSTSLNEGILGRELMTPDEVGQMPDSDCVLLIRGIHPFYSHKYIIEDHRNYHLLEDANPDNAYDISHVQTEIMPMSADTDNNTEYEEEEFIDNDDTIRNILANSELDVSGNQVDIVSSKIEIPHDDSDVDDSVVEIEKGGGDIMPDAENVDDNDVIIIEDLDLKEQDKFSDLNFDEDFKIKATDEYVVDPYQE
jgi:type IV secretion system protein VirD4